MVACRKCGAGFDDAGAKFCPKCGVPEPLSDAAGAARGGAGYSYSKPMGNWVWWVGIPIGLVAAFLGFGAMLPDNPEQTRARRVYELCLSDLASADRARSSTSVILADMCERLRKDYVAKYRSTP